MIEIFGKRDSGAVSPGSMEMTAEKDPDGAAESAASEEPAGQADRAAGPSSVSGGGGYSRGSTGDTAEEKSPDCREDTAACTADVSPVPGGSLADTGEDCAAASSGRAAYTAGQEPVAMVSVPEELWDRLERMLLNYEEQGQLLEQLIKKQIEAKDLLIDKLHRELEYYKKDGEERYRDQVMKSVIRVRQGMSRSMGRDGWAEKSADDLRNEYLYIYEDITDLLQQNGIDSYSSDEGTEFDPAIHQPRTEITSDRELDRKVKKSLSDGYMKDGRTMIPERVIVYQYKE